MNPATAETEAIELVVCDDHPLYAQGLASALEAEDGLVVVGVATSAEEALALVREKLPDVVLMDIYMPKVDGIEATRQICSSSSSTQVIMLTVSDREKDLLAAIKAGATGYVTKDRDASEIAATIRQVHRGNYTFPTFLARKVLSDLDQSADPLSQLTPQERAILAGLADGETDADIAKKLIISERTFRRRLLDIRSRLFLASRLEAAVFAAKHGLGSNPDSERS